MMGFTKQCRAFRRLKPLIKTLWTHLKRYKPLILSACGVSLLFLLFRLIQPWPLKWIFDLLTNAKTPLPKEIPIGEAVALMSVAYIFVTTLTGLSEYLQRRILAGLGNQTMLHFRSQLLCHLLAQSVGYHERRPSGELLTRVIYDTSRLKRGLNGILLRTCQNALLFIFTCSVLIWIEPWLALPVLLTGLLATLSMGSSGGRILKATRRLRKKEGKLASIVEELLAGIRELHVFRPGVGSDPRFEKCNRTSTRSDQKARRLEAMLLLKVEILWAIGICVVLLLGARSVAAGKLTAGDLVLFLTYVTALYRPFLQFARQAAQTGRTMACAERLAKILRSSPAIASPPQTVEMSHLSGSIGFDGVILKSSRRRRGSRKKVLADLSFHIHPGERVALMGPNGSGKSSILRLVLRLADPNRGIVSIQGRNIRDYEVEALRHSFSTIFQDTLLFNIAVRENIALGKPEADQSSLIRAAEQAGLGAFISRLRNGYDTVVRQRGRLFSGGERQRLAIARALLRDGSIWLLDEPTAYLDAQSAAELEETLLDATRGRTTLWVTHDLRTASRLDRILLLSDGRVRFLGTVPELREWLAQAKTEGDQKYFDELTQKGF